MGKFRWDWVPSHIWRRASYNTVHEETCTNIFTVYEKVVSHIWLCTRIYPNIWGKFYFIFYQWVTVRLCSVWGGVITRLYCEEYDVLYYFNYLSFWSSLPELEDNRRRIRKNALLAPLSSARISKSASATLGKKL